MPINIISKYPVVYDVSATVQATGNANGIANAALIANMTLTPFAGRYFFAFTGSFGYSVSNVNVFASIYVAGSEYSGGEYRRSTVPFGKNGTAADRAVMAITGMITVLEGQTVEVRWYSEGGTMTCDQRCITLAQVG